MVPLRRTNRRSESVLLAQPAAPTPTTAPALFDRTRGTFYRKPRWRGWLHLVSFEIALVLGTLLIVTADGPAEHVAAAVYGSTVAGMFGVSALYHRGAWSERASHLLQRADHLMILLLIAGTATPPVVIALHGGWRIAAVSVLASVTALSVAVRSIWLRAPERLVGALYVTLGWLAGATLPAIWVQFGVAPAVLILLGGLLYSAGAICFHRRRPDPVPHVFGYHEVFHAFVCAAAACQYVAIALFLL